MGRILMRSALAESPLADLHLLANELGVDGFRRLRKLAQLPRPDGQWAAFVKQMCNLARITIRDERQRVAKSGPAGCKPAGIQGGRVGHPLKHVASDSSRPSSPLGPTRGPHAHRTATPPSSRREPNQRRELQLASFRPSVVRPQSPSSAPR